MPIYIVKCDECGVSSERIRLLSEFGVFKQELTTAKCKNCGNEGCLHLAFGVPGSVDSDVRKHEKVMKGRYKKRNKRIEGMSEESQSRMKDFMRHKGVKKDW